ncbi:Trehalose transport system permease protein SugB [subsurface metagenome]
MRSYEGKIKQAVTYSLIGIFLIWILFFFYWALTNSFKPRLETFNPGSLIPFLHFTPTLDSWILLFFRQMENLPLAVVNSIIVSLGTTGIVLVLGTMAAYSLSRFEFKLLKNKNLVIWFLSQRVLPPVVVLVPFFMILMRLHLLDTRLGLILTYVTFSLPFGIVIMRDVFKDIPLELEEAGLVDGASDFQIFYKICLPLVKNGLIATAIIVFAFCWNEALFAVSLTSSEAQTLPVYILAARKTRGVHFGIAGANTIVAIAPPVILILFIQKYLVRGLTLGAVKG